MWCGLLKSNGQITNFENHYFNLIFFFSFPLSLNFRFVRILKSINHNKYVIFRYNSSLTLIFILAYFYGIVCNVHVIKCFELRENQNFTNFANKHRVHCNVKEKIFKYYEIIIISSTDFFLFYRP